MSVKKRADNSWTISVYLGKDNNGKKEYYYETFYAAKKSDANKREKELEHDLKSKIGSSKASAKNVGELIDKWLSSIKIGIEPSTFDTYAKQIKKVRPLVEDLMLYTLDTNQIEDRLNKLNAENLKPRTIKNFYAILRRVLNWGAKRNLVQPNLMDSIKSPKIQRTKRPVLDQQDLTLFLETAKDYKHYLPLRLLALTGLRCGEVIGLKWHNIDLIQGYLKVVESVNSRSRNQKETKTINSERTINLDLETIQLLTKQKNSTNANDSDFVFMSQDGEPLRHQVLFKAKKIILKKANLRNIRLHDLRHGVGSILLDKGESLIYVAGFLGQSPATTAGIYGHALRTGDTSKVLG
ncbi:tyrosine recombinase XerD [Desulfosporosinus acididurans]|uniref:Tyrosine recombinase XerD n=1 Tax=Desulfosporosinus acididurans TaxID=476652 RepID=A0A0J1FK39_9FIRM|nr:site-specific integrase [Desulfosporosinus acididurans]KLU63825.1 tyrosine recombinase XerD [Desulfosporosinus acididurans]